MAGIKLKAKAKDGVVEVKALMSHPMETGQRKDKKTGDKIPAHFIEKIEVTANDKNVLTAEWSGSVSKDPYLSFSYAGAAGDKLKLSWTDNKGESESADTEVK